MLLYVLLAKMLIGYFIQLISFLENRQYYGIYLKCKKWNSLAACNLPSICNFHFRVSLIYLMYKQETSLFDKMCSLNRLICWKLKRLDDNEVCCNFWLHKIFRRLATDIISYYIIQTFKFIYWKLVATLNTILKAIM